MILLAQERPFFDWDWVERNVDELWARLGEHLALTWVAVLVGFALASLLAMASLRWPRTYQPISASTGFLYTIPSLAVFAFVAPIVGIGTAGGRFFTSEIALVSYTLLILVRNIVTGIRAVPPESLEAAVGMGYRPRELLLEIQLPLALPAIVAGLRIATVTVVGLVTVTSLLGMGGLGFFILNGLRKSIVFPTEIIVGVILSIALAAVLDAALLLTGRLLTPWARGRVA